MRVLSLLLALSFGASAQFINRIRLVMVDPAGTCGPSYITQNTTTGNLMGCVNGVWTSLGPSGTGITSLNGLNSNTQTFVNDTNVTVTSAGTTHTFGWSGTLAKNRTLASTVYTDQGNNYGAFLQDLSAATIKAPTASGFTASAASMIGYDSAVGATNFHIYAGADKVLAPVTGSITNGHCPQFTVATNNILIGDSGQANCLGNTLQVNGTPLTSSATVNFQSSSAFNGLTFTMANPSAGNVQIGASGTLGVGGGGTGITSGTSGGIPAFTASGTIASSGVLTANLPVIGGGAGAAPSVGTVSGNTTQFVTTTGTQTNTAVVAIDASGNHVATTCTISSGAETCPGAITSGSGSGNTGYLQLSGATSGSVELTVANVAGTQAALIIPNPTGASTSTFLQLGASTTCPTGVPGTCYNTAWASPAGSGTVTSSTIGQIPVYTAATTVAGNTALTYAAGVVSIGAVGTQGELDLLGSTSGTTKIVAQSSGGGTMTLQAGSDTIVGRATTDTLTNKTINCANNTCTIPAANRIRAIAFTVGDPTNSGALTTSYTSYVTVPFACTISAYNLLIDAADATIKVKFWKVATGTAIPTVANSISTSGVGVPSGTAVHSTTLTDFTTTAVAANDIIAMNVATANTAKMVNGVIECDQ